MLTFLCYIVFGIICFFLGVYYKRMMFAMAGILKRKIKEEDSEDSKDNKEVEEDVYSFNKQSLINQTRL